MSPRWAMSRMRVKGTDAVYASVKDGSLRSQGRPAPSSASLPPSVHCTQMWSAACKTADRGAREKAAQRRAAGAVTWGA